MISPEVRAQINQLEIYTRRILRSQHVGDYRTAVKGSGFEFESLREYVPGDDIRFIDWHATARTGKFLVRQYYEERSRNVMLLLDGSASTIYGTEHARFERMREIATVLALAGSWMKDGVGLVIFSDDINLHVPPTRSPAKIRRLIETIYEYTPRGKTNFQQVFKKLNGLRVKNTLTFLISDFIGDNFQSSLRALAQKNDVVAVRCLDEAEKQLPAWGVVEFQDPETQERVFVDARKGNGRLRKDFFNHWRQETLAQLQGCGIDLIDLSLEKPYMAELIRFFRRRVMYR